MHLPELEWNDSLADIYTSGKRNAIDLKMSIEFDAACSRYRQKLSHVSMIWDRLRADIDAEEKQVKFLSFVTKSKTAGKLTTKEAKTLEEHTRIFETLYLDYEDFLIHSRILMDRVIFLTKFLMRGMGNRPKTTGFTQHREWFFKATSKGFPDEVYAKYMRESTEWFETLLRSYRNEFVVHDTRFNMFGVMSGPSHTPRLWKTRYVDMTKWDSHLKMLITLRDKYLNKIPGLDTVSVNLYDLVDFLDSHSSTINPEDLHTLREIRVFVGGKLPDLVELAEHIQKFLLFFGTHFRDAMSPKA